jgi:hypothetical protein
MSRLNGDKSRFHRIRKANSLRRTKSRELREQLTTGILTPSDAQRTEAAPVPKKAR